MKKRVGIILAGFVLPVLCSGVCGAKGSIIIGFSAPMTGQYSAYGKDFKDAADLAIGQINQGGGIDGRSVELSVEDSRGIPKIAKRIARKFAADKRIVAEIGDFTSSCSMAASPIYKKAGLVQLSPTGSHPSFAPGSPFSFSIAGTQAGMGPLMAEKAVKVLKKQKLAVLHINNDWGMASQQFFIDEAKLLGATIVAVESYLDGTTNFTKILGKLRELQPELLYICSMYKDGAAICGQLRKLGWDDVAVMGARPLFSMEFIKLSGQASENVYTSTTFFPRDPRAEVQDFVKAYKKSYNRIPNSYAARGYDAANLLVKAIKDAGTDRKAIRHELERIKDFPGITGKISFTRHGNVARERVLLLRVKNGEFVLNPEQ